MSFNYKSIGHKWTSNYHYVEALCDVHDSSIWLVHECIGTDCRQKWSIWNFILEAYWVILENYVTVDINVPKVYFQPWNPIVTICPYHQIWLKFAKWKEAKRDTSISDIKLFYLNGEKMWSILSIWRDLIRLPCQYIVIINRILKYVYDISCCTYPNTERINWLT